MKPNYTADTAILSKPHVLAYIKGWLVQMQSTFPADFKVFIHLQMCHHHVFQLQLGDQQQGSSVLQLNSESFQPSNEWRKRRRKKK